MYVCLYQVLCTISTYRAAFEVVTKTAWYAVRDAAARASRSLRWLLDCLRVLNHSFSELVSLLRVATVRVGKLILYIIWTW